MVQNGPKWAKKLNKMVKNGKFLPVKYGRYPSKWQVLAKAMGTCAKINGKSLSKYFARLFGIS